MSETTAYSLSTPDFYPLSKALFSMLRSDWFKNNFPQATALDIHSPWEPSQSEGSFLKGSGPDSTHFIPSGLLKEERSRSWCCFIVLRKMISLFLALKTLAHWLSGLRNNLKIGLACWNLWEMLQNWPTLTHVLNSVWFSPTSILSSNVFSSRPEAAAIFLHAWPSHLSHFLLAEE